MRILLVEDDHQLHTNLVKHLKSDSYSVDGAFDGEEGLFKACEYEYDALIIDLGLPKLNGLELIERLRQEGRDSPILILTARDSWQDKVQGLDMGADDYLTKPFQLEELSARVNALIRRRSGQTSPLIQNGPYELNTRALSLNKSGQSIVLSSHEYKVLEYLMMHMDEVVSKTRLTEHVYNEDFDLDSNVIEVFVGRLRKKLDPDNSITPIETLRGQGYRLRSLKSA